MLRVKLKGFLYQFYFFLDFILMFFLFISGVVSEFIKSNGSR
jgi:hypothetical protein